MCRPYEDEPRVRRFIVRVKSNGPLELLLGRGPVPIVTIPDESQRSVGFGEPVVEAKSLFRCHASVLHSFCCGQHVKRRGQEERLVYKS